MRTCLAVSALLLFPNIATAASPPPLNAVFQWNNAALQGVRDAKLGAPMVARALAITHTCMYDAWAAYDDRAVGTQLAGALRRPASERTEANKERAISYATYRALVDVLPGDTDSVYVPLMKKLGYDPKNASTDIETPEGIGNVACAAVLEFRHHDKSNQLGDLAPGAYSDWTRFMPANMPGTIPMRLPAIHPIDVSRWQPLIYVDSSGSMVTQMFMGAQWCFVTPFAMASGDEFRGAVESSPPAVYGSAEYREQADELVAMSAGLTDQQKMIAEYWSDGTESEQAPARWSRFAQFVSARDNHTLDDDVKMFFALTNAMLDASIAAWDAKRAYDSVRPITAIPLVFKDENIRAWGGPGRYGRDGRSAVDSISARDFSFSVIPRVRLRREHVQRRRRFDSGRMDGKRPLRRLGNNSRRQLEDRAGNRSGAPTNFAMGNFQ
jgi:hypothetical protein